MNKNKSTYRPDLQGLRAIAILLIIATHSSLGVFLGGFVGVDVFFVLSGYLITNNLLKELSVNKKIQLARFYAGRLKRLLPALLFMITIVIILTTTLLSNTEAFKQLSSSLFATSWTSNIYFAFSIVDYFDELSTKDMFIHTWSLGVEEQFYLFWPLLLLFLYNTRLFNPSIDKLTFKPLIIGLLITGLSSFLLSLYLTSNFPLSAFYLMPSRIWQFTLGGIIAVTANFNETQNNIFYSSLKKFNRTFTIIGICFILGSAIYFKPNMSYPGFWALIPSIGSMFIIASGHLNRNPFLNNSIFTWIGNRSYSLYLWHWPTLMIGFTIGFKGLVVPTLFLILITIVFSKLSYDFIELPFWKGKYSHIGTNRFIGLSLISMIIVTSIIIINQYYIIKPNKVYQSSIWKNDLPIIYSMGCDETNISATVTPCIFGNQTSKKTVVILGDSILAQWFSAFEKIFKKRNWKIILLTKSSCPMVDENVFYNGKTFEICRDWRNAVTSKLIEYKPSLVILGNSATYDFTREEWVHGSLRILKKISQISQKVLVIPGTPNLNFQGPGCISRHSSTLKFNKKTDCVSKYRIQLIAPVIDILKSNTEKISNVYFLNLNSFVCPNDSCYAMQQNMAVFRDSQHLTNEFVLSLTDKISIGLKSLEIID